MAGLIPRVIIAGLAASISPVAVMVLLSVMMRKHARRNSLLFLLGFTLVLIAFGVTVIFLFSAGVGGSKHKVDGFIDLALGALCLAAIPITLRRKKKQEETETEKDLKAPRAFLLGAASMLVNTSTIVCYLAGAHEIAAAKLNVSDDLFALTLLTAITLLTLLIPIAVYFAVPTKAERVLGSLNAWLSRHSKVIGAAVLLLFGAYLLAKGLKAVV
jgi:threonine/homoserine/homoserine lactone efflux protein